MIEEQQMGLEIPLPDTITLEAFQVMPAPKPEEYEALKASIRHHGGCQYPLVLDPQNNILDGHNRYRAYRELLDEGHEVRAPRCVVRHDAVEDWQKRAIARELNRTRRELTPAQKRKIVREQLLDTPAWADNRIGETCGVAKNTVRKMRSKMELNGEIDYHPQLEGRDGTWKARSRTGQGMQALDRMGDFLEGQRRAAEPEEDGELAPRARGPLAQPTAQTEEARKRRRQKNAYRKSLYALSQLMEATDEPAEEVAALVPPEEAYKIARVYGHVGGWLSAFVGNLEEGGEKENGR